MKKIPSSATIDPRNRQCDTGAALSAFGRWLILAPMAAHAHSNMGKEAATITAADMSVMMVSGLFGIYAGGSGSELPS